MSMLSSLVDHIGQHMGRGHHEQRVLHVVAIGAVGLTVAVYPEGFDEGKDPVANGLAYGSGLKGPASALAV